MSHAYPTHRPRHSWRNARRSGDYLRRATWASLILAGGGLAACGLDPTVLAGRACDQAGACAAGYACDLPSGQCLPAAGSACAPEGATQPCGLERGACRAGVIACQGGAWQACSATSGTAETCNGIDDDCDGATDEDWPLKDSACQASYLQCSIGGSWICAADGASLACTAQLSAGSEVCDGQDNDCDGLTDELDADFDTYYACPFWGAARDCDDHATMIHPGASEWCNGQDDDCDGLTDEDFADLGQPCTVGSGNCSGSGVRVCRANGTGTYCQASAPTTSAERCNGIDDDCDGLTDEDFADLGQPCAVGIGRCYNTGVRECTLDGLQTRCGAVPYAPEVERCNGEDDDCNGHTDELDGDGDLHYGCPYWRDSKDWDCNDADGDIHREAEEVCDLIDNNCDGQTDEAGWTGGLTDCTACFDVCYPLAGGAGTHATTTCQGAAGGCTFSCQYNWYDLDGQADNGCELADDLNGSVLNNRWQDARRLGSFGNCDANAQSVKGCGGRLPRDARVHVPAVGGDGQGIDYFAFYYYYDDCYYADANVVVQAYASADAGIQVCISNAVSDDGSGNPSGAPTFPGGTLCGVFNPTTSTQIRFAYALPTTNRWYFVRVRALADDGAGHVYARYGGEYGIKAFENPSPNDAAWSVTCP